MMNESNEKAENVTTGPWLSIMYGPKKLKVIIPKKTAQFEAPRVEGRQVSWACRKHIGPIEPWKLIRKTEIIATIPIVFSMM